MAITKEVRNGLVYQIETEEAYTIESLIGFEYILDIVANRTNTVENIVEIAGTIIKETYTNEAVALNSVVKLYVNKQYVADLVATDGVTDFSIVLNNVADTETIILHVVETDLITGTLVL